MKVVRVRQDKAFDGDGARPGTGRDDCTRVQDVVELSSIQVRPATNRQKAPREGHLAGKTVSTRAAKRRRGAPVHRQIISNVSSRPPRPQTLQRRSLDR